MKKYFTLLAIILLVNGVSADTDDDNIYTVLTKEPYSTPVILIIVFVILTIIAMAVFLLYLYLIAEYVHNRVIIKRQPGPVDYDVEILKLQEKKREIEDMIKIATYKFRKRKLDDQSFREIVKDQQEKLIEIEAKIKDIERRMSKLEKIKVSR